MPTQRGSMKGARVGPYGSPNHLPVEPQTFADVVLRCRKDNGLTQAEFAELFEGVVLQSQLEKWGQRALRSPPRRESLAKLAEVCGVSPGELLEKAGYFGVPKEAGAEIDSDSYRSAAAREIARLANRLRHRQARAVLAVMRSMVDR